MTDILKSGSSPREARTSHFASMLRLSAVTGRIFHATWWALRHAAQSGTL